MQGEHSSPAELKQAQLSAHVPGAHAAAPPLQVPSQHWQPPGIPLSRHMHSPGQTQSTGLAGTLANASSPHSSAAPLRLSASLTFLLAVAMRIAAEDSIAQIIPPGVSYASSWALAVESCKFPRNSATRCSYRGHSFRLCIIIPADIKNCWYNYTRGTSWLTTWQQKL